MPDIPPIELIACDMDGTMLTDEFVLSAGTKTAIRRVLERGIRVVLVSGRMVRTLRPFHTELGLTAPVIGYNGAMIWDMGRSEVLAHTPIPHDIAQEIVRFALAEKLHVQYFWNDQFWAQSRTSWMELYESRIRLQGEIIPDLTAFDADRPPTKMQLISHPEQVRELVAHLRKQYAGRLYATTTLPEYVEMMHPEVSKGRALAQLGEALGIPTERMLAFGDAQNDETMFAVAGVSVAMGNARDEVKQKTTFVTESNNDEGIAKALARMKLLGD